MTIAYDLTTANPLSFFKLLRRWHGSAWKNCAREYLVWIVTYFLVTYIVSHEMLPLNWHEILNDIVHYLDRNLSYIPIVLLLGFFVTFVIDRWKNILNNIGFIDCAAFVISSQIQGDAESIVTQRRNILRYLCLAQVLTLRDISLRVRRRFPTLESLVQSNLLLEHELALLRDKNSIERYTTPINWAVRLSANLRLENCISSDTVLQAVVKEITEFQRLNQNLCNYDWVPVPLAYPQVAFCVVRSYLFISLFARQVVFEHNAKTVEIDMESWAMFIMTMLQVFFYLAWVKAAEEMLNPLGIDDNDFECNFVIDYNISLPVRLADSHHGQIPTQIKDEFDQQTSPLYLEHVLFKSGHGYRGSVTGINMTQNKKIIMVPRQKSTDQNMSNVFSASSSSSILLPVRMMRRLTHPLTFKRRYSTANTHLPTISKQPDVQTTIHPDEFYRKLPETVATLYQENSFAESYAFQCHPKLSTSTSTTDEPIFAQSIRHDVYNICCKPSDVYITLNARDCSNSIDTQH